MLSAIGFSKNDVRADTLNSISFSHREKKATKKFEHGADKKFPFSLWRWPIN